MNTLLNSTSLKMSLRRRLSHSLPVRLVGRFRQDEDGIAAIEFAIIAPIMIIMYFGLAEIASAISVDRRVSHGTNVAGDLATQQPEIRDGEIEEIVSAALRVLDIRDINNVSMDIESFILPSAGDPPESRGRIRVNNSAGGFTNFDASGLDTKLLNENSGVVVTRVSYEYTPIELRYFKSDISLEETFLLKPRRSDAVQIQDGNGSLIDCTATSFADVTCTVTN
jgi:Flp pilus assembly protein TadG